MTDAIGRTSGAVVRPAWADPAGYRLRGATRSATALLLIGTLAACSGNDGAATFGGATGTGDVATRRATRLIERDVEAPDVFQVAEAGLWDGRPSLGGVWVAHPDVKDPERVLIRNTATDSFVIGALFRRERANPGPRLQVSSDAAAALGMLAGAPATLSVTALRREEQTDPSAGADPAPGAGLPQDVALLPDAEAMPADGMAAPSRPEAKRPWWKKIFGGRDTDATADRAPDRATNGASDLAVASGAMTAASPDGAFQAAAPVETRTLAGNAAPPPAGDPVGSGPQSGAPAMTPPAAMAVPASAPPPTPRPASTLDRPYLQIGIFSVEQNARNTATAMRQAGMIPTVREQSSKGKTFWRVLVGPATSADERSDLLAKVKREGFTDAYAVTN